MSRDAAPLLLVVPWPSVVLLPGPAFHNLEASGGGREKEKKKGKKARSKFMLMLKLSGREFRPVRAEDPPLRSPQTHTHVSLTECALFL